MKTYTPVLKNGQHVKFNLHNISPTEFGYDNSELEIGIEDLDGQHATILNFDNATAGQDDEPEQDFEYYTIRFDNGVTLEAISGYHLTVVE